MSDRVSAIERSRIMGAVKGKDTAPEMIVRRLVFSMGYRYRLHVRSLAGTPDLVFPARRKVLFISGCFWHGHNCGKCRIPKSNREYWIAKIGRNRARDRRSHRALRKLGWDVMTIWECQLKDLDQLKRRAKAFLKQRHGGSTDNKLLAVRVFDEKTKKVAYTKQTQAVKGKDKSNCPLCAVGHDANKARIYDFNEMDADHVAAWSKGGDSSAKNCQMLCSTHNRAKGNR